MNVIVLSDCENSDDSDCFVTDISHSQKRKEKGLMPPIKCYFNTPGVGKPEAVQSSQIRKSPRKIYHMALGQQAKRKKEENKRTKQDAQNQVGVPSPSTEILDIISNDFSVFSLKV